MERPWLKQPGECFDSQGIPIYPGDLLRTFHFIGSRRRKNYLYHVAVMDREAGALRMVPVFHLDAALRDHADNRGGNPLLSDGLGAEATVIDGQSFRDGDGFLRLWYERPRKAAEAAKEEEE